MITVEPERRPVDVGRGICVDNGDEVAEIVRDWLGTRSN
jgi:hypothetical protein